MSEGSAPKTGTRPARDQLVIRLEEEAACASPRRAALIRYELARLLEAEPADTERALEGYEASGAFAPAARAVTRLRIVRGEAGALIPSLRAEEECARDDEARAAALIERALVRLTELSESGKAREELEQALALLPGHEVAMTALTELYEQDGDHADLEQLLRQQADACGDARRGAELLCRAGQVRARHLDDPDQASALYRAAMAADPDCDAARQGLLGLSRAAGDRAGAARMLEEMAERRGGADAAGLLAEAGRLHLEAPGDLDEALRCLKRALPLTPREARGPLLLDVARLLVNLDRHTEAAAALTEARSSLQDPCVAAMAALELGRLQLGALEDPETGATSLRAALDLDPELEPARALLEHTLLQEGAYEDLASHYRRDLARGARHAPRAGLLLGRLLEGPLADPTRAVEAYQQVLALRPGWRPALLGLSRAYRATGNPADALAAHEAQLLGLRDQGEKIWVLEQMAEIALKEVGDQTRAATLLERILAMDPGHAASRTRLVAIYEALGRWPHLAAVLRAAADRTEDQATRLQILDQLAWLHMHRLLDSDSALEAFQGILAIDPDFLPAQEGAARLLGAAGRSEERLAVLRRAEGHRLEPLDSARVALRAARTLGHDLGRWDEAAAAAAAVIRRCEDQAEQAPAWRRLQDAACEFAWSCHARGALTDAAELLPLTPAPEGPADAASLHCRLARALERLGDSRGAREHLARALEADPRCETAHMLMADRPDPGQDPEELASLLNTRLEGLGPGQERDDLIYRLIWLEARRGMDPEKTIALVDRLSSPGDSRAMVALLELNLARVQDWRRLTALLSRRGDGASGDEAPPLALYRSASQLVAAGLTEDRLDDLKRAAHLAFLVLEQHPHQEEALAVLERHYRAAANLPGLIQILGRRLGEVDNALEQAALLNGLGAAYARGRDLDRACGIFREAAEALASYLPAPRSWARACIALKVPHQLALARAAEASASQVQRRRVESTLEAADLWREALADSQRAIAAYRQLLRIDPDNQAGADALIALLEQEEEWEQLNELRLARAAATPETMRDTLLQVARTRRQQLGHLQGARAALVRALELEPDDPELWHEMAEACRAASAWEDLTRALRRLLEFSPAPHLAASLRFELGEVLHEELDAPDEAASELEAGLALTPHHLDALDRLADIHTGQERWDKAATCLEEMIDQEHRRDRLVALHLRLARIQDAGQDDPIRAADSLRRALAQDPGNMEATSRLAETLRRLGNQLSLEDHLRNTLGVHRVNIDRDPTRVDAYQSMLQVLAQQQDPDGQMVLQQALVAIDPDALEATPAPAVPGTRVGRLARPLGEAELDQLTHPDLPEPLIRLLAGAAAAIRKSHPPLRAPAPPGPPVTPENSPKLSALVAELGGALELQGELAMFLDGRRAGGFRLMDSAPPTLVLGQGLQGSDPDEVAFRVGRLLARARLDFLLPARLGADRLGQLVAALLGLTCRVFSSPVPAETLEPLRAKLDRALNRDAHRRLASPALELSDQAFAPERWLQAMQATEDRISLLLCGSPRAALAVLRAEEQRESREAAPWVPASQAARLLRFIVSEEHLDLRKKLLLQR